MAMDSEEKYMAIACVCVCIVLIVIILSGPIGDWLNQDVALVEKQIELEKLKQKNENTEKQIESKKAEYNLLKDQIDREIELRKKNDIQGKDKNKPADNKPGL